MELTKDTRDRIQNRRTKLHYDFVFNSRMCNSRATRRLTKR